jgi:hypothetical protein
LDLAKSPVERISCAGSTRVPDGAKWHRPAKRILTDLGERPASLGRFPKFFARFARFARLALTLFRQSLHRSSREQRIVGSIAGRGGVKFRVPDSGFRVVEERHQTRESETAARWGERTREPFSSSEASGSRGRSLHPLTRIAVNVLELQNNGTPGIRAGTNGQTQSKQVGASRVNNRDAKVHPHRPVWARRLNRIVGASQTDDCSRRCEEADGHGFAFSASLRRRLQTVASSSSSADLASRQTRSRSAKPSQTESNPVKLSKAKSGDQSIDGLDALSKLQIIDNQLIMSKSKSKSKSRSRSQKTDVCRGFDGPLICLEAHAQRVGPWNPRIPRPRVPPDQVQPVGKSAMSNQGFRRNSCTCSRRRCARSRGRSWGTSARPIESGQWHH